MQRDGDRAMPREVLIASRAGDGDLLLSTPVSTGELEEDAEADTVDAEADELHLAGPIRNCAEWSSHTVMVAVRLAHSALNEHVEGLDFDSRRWRSRRCHASSGDSGLRQRKFLNMHMPAPVGSFSIVFALRSRQRENPLCASNRKSSASEIPFRFHPALLFDAMFCSRMMSGWHWRSRAKMLQSPWRATKDCSDAASDVTTIRANSRAIREFSGETRGRGMLLN